MDTKKAKGLTMGFQLSRKGSEDMRGVKDTRLINCRSPWHRRIDGVGISKEEGWKVRR